MLEMAEDTPPRVFFQSFKELKEGVEEPDGRRSRVKVLLEYGS